MKTQNNITKQSKSPKNTLISNLIKRNFNEQLANSMCIVCEAGGSGSGNGF